MALWNFFLTHSPIFYAIQSFWRDEAFSVLFARYDLISIILKSSFDPPLYYLMLHFWIRIFGTGEVAVRSFSLLGFALSTVVIIEWSDSIFRKRFLAWFVPLMYFFNPMLIYYAFEARAYGWYMFFAALAMYAFFERKPRLYAVSAILGFYTHLFISVLLFSQAVFFVAGHLKNLRARKIRTVLTDPMVRSWGVIALASVPWFVHLASFVPQLGSSWYYPVDFHLFKSVLGNMFVGYDGTPWFLWDYTAIVSTIILAAGILAVVRPDTRKYGSYFAAIIGVSLGMILGISVFKPLFVNRYLIFVSMAEVMLLGLALQAIPGRRIAAALSALLFVCIMAFNGWYPLQHAKTDFRTPVREINAALGKNDVLYVDNALSLLETLYYAKDPSRVFWYNPGKAGFPWYIGDMVFSPSMVRTQLPTYPDRAFIMKMDGTYTLEFGETIGTGQSTSKRTP